MTLSGTVPAGGAAHWLEEIGKKTRAKMHKRMPHRPVKTLVTNLLLWFICRVNAEWNYKLNGASLDLGTADEAKGKTLHQ